MLRRLPVAAVAFCCAAASLGVVAQSHAANAVPDELPLTTASGSAPVFDPGFYAGRVASGAVRYAKVTRKAAETLTVSLVTSPSVIETPATLSIDLQLADGTSCAKDTTSSSRVDSSSGIRAASVLIEATPTKRGSSYSPEGCSKATDLLLALEVTDGPSTDVHLAVTAEPRVTGNAGNPAEGTAQTPPLAPSLQTPAEPVLGRASYDSATTLTSGSYSLTLQPQQLQTFRVRVGWGQRVGVSLEAPRNGTNFAPSADTDVGVTLFSPQLVPLNPYSVQKKYTNTTLSANNGEPDMVATGSATVAWANRNASQTATDSKLSTDALNWASVAGWYYVTVWSTASASTTTSNSAPANAARDIPSRLNLVVKGAAGAGPTYVDTSGATISQPEPGALSQGGDSAGLPWVRIGLSGVALLLAGLAVAWSIVRRRGTPRSA